MKNIIITVVTILIGMSGYAQLDENAMLGTWEAELSGNRIFRIEVFELPANSEFALPNNPLQGNFEMVEVDSNGNETIIYTSVSPYDNVNLIFPSSFWLNIDGGSQVSGIITDLTASKVSEGQMRLNYISSSPLTISWYIYQTDGGPHRPLNIPTDLTLTKQ